MSNYAAVFSVLVVGLTFFAIFYEASVASLFSRTGLPRTNCKKMSSTNSAIAALGTGLKVVRNSCRNSS